MTAPEQLTPPVYACAAGAVLHAHAADTLEPAVLLHTFLPPGAGEQLEAAGSRVDVHADGAGTGTLTVRVLTDGRSLSWSLPIAPFVAALPGQPGDEGRMVLLAVVDGEPPSAFWAAPVDCEQLAAELQLPVVDLAEALRGRLTPWLADDLEGLLHDDAHDRAVERSPAQTLADAVLAHYRGDLDAEQVAGRLVRAVELAPEEYAFELSALLCQALVSAVMVSRPEHVAAVLAETGPFETEALRLLEQLPPLLAETRTEQRTDAVLTLLVAGPDREETVRAAVSVVARLAREAFGPGRPDGEVLHRPERLLEGSGEVDLASAADALAACIALARFVRARAGVGPGAWLQGPAPAAAAAVTAELLDGLDRDLAVDLLAELLDEDVEALDVIDGFVCATAQVLADVDPRGDAALRPAQLAALLSSVPAGPRGARWMLATLLREAPRHDPAAADLTAFLPGDVPVDPDRAAQRAGRSGVLRAGLSSLEALADAFGSETHLSRADVLGAVLPTALVEHDLLRRPA